jgi:hypothetical protein
MGSEYFLRLVHPSVAHLTGGGGLRVYKGGREREGEREREEKEREREREGGREREIEGT